MGTKNNPGEFDYYAKTDPDEPIFVIRANDHFGPSVVERWVSLAEWFGVDAEKVQEARLCAVAMREWRIRQGKS